MFRPAGQVQQPLLLEAINSLKLAAILKREGYTYIVVAGGKPLKSITIPTFLEDMDIFIKTIIIRDEKGVLGNYLRLTPIKKSYDFKLEEKNDETNFKL